MRYTLTTVIARLASGYDPEDEALMAWLSLPDVRARFDASRERAARGERIERAEALRALGITEEEVAAETAHLKAEDADGG